MCVSGVCSGAGFVLLVRTKDVPGSLVASRQRRRQLTIQCYCSGYTQCTKLHVSLLKGNNITATPSVFVSQKPKT